jgi:LysM repeat protein
MSKSTKSLAPTYCATVCAFKRVQKYGFSAICKLVLLLSFSVSAVHAQQQRLTPQNYIDNYAQAAIDNMVLKKVPASITLAQGMLESGYGNSWLARQSNNHFGIKCHGRWSGRKVYADDDLKNECFRAYASVLESYADHADFLVNGQRYRFLFSLRPTDYKGWARGLKKAGYATNPKYADKLIRLIEQYELNKYDELALLAERPAVMNENQPVSSRVFTPTEVNKLDAVVVGQPQSLKSFAKAIGISWRRLRRYNELPRKYEPKAGEVLFLELKRGKTDHPNVQHTVKAGESLLSISQLYGVQKRALEKANNLRRGSEVQAGQVLALPK